MSMSRLPMMLFGAIYTQVMNASANLHFIIGMTMVLMSIGILEKKMLPKFNELTTLMGLGTLVFFVGGILIGASFIFGDYSLLGFAITKSLAEVVGYLVLAMGAIAFIVEG